MVLIFARSNNRETTFIPVFGPHNRALRTTEKAEREREREWREREGERKRQKLGEMVILLVYIT